jgi:hypothetical protein
MADISKCLGKDCKLKYHCYRYTAPNGYWQAYGDFKPTTSRQCDSQIKQKCPHCGIMNNHRASCVTNRI